MGKRKKGFNMDKIMEFVMYTIIMPPIICVYLAILVVSFKFGLNLFFKIINKWRK
jgi:hypothetical protein